MIRHRTALLGLCAPLVAFAAAGDAPRARDTTAVSQTTLPIFTPEGYRAMFFRGSSGDFSEDGRSARMQDMQLTVYVGDAADTVESIVVAPEAALQIDRQIVSGEKSVRILRDDIDASAVKWSYDRKEKFISLAGSVKVIFKAEIKDVLK